MDKLSLVSLNINGLKNDKKRKALFTLLRSNNYDIIFLQETHCHLKRAKEMVPRVGWTINLVFGLL